MIDPRSLVAVLIGGGLGSALRYLISIWMLERLGSEFPWHTLAINVSGSLLIGIIGELSQLRGVGPSPVWRIFLVVGLLGGFTTFSSFSYDALNLFTARAGWLSLGYVLASVVLGVGAAFLGVAFVRAIVTHSVF